MMGTDIARLRAVLLCTASMATAATALTAPALAQEAQDQDAEATAEEVIVVTGSLIANPNLERSSPIQVTSSDEIELKQSTLAEQVLRDLPGIVPSIGTAVNNGNIGASFVDLRGLGSKRNVVLLDGRRLVPSDVNGRVDLNNIPLALVERVDSLTGSAVTTYGADAVSGVVNFVTKDDFAGAELSGSFQLTEKGDGNIFRVDATIGANFDDGRGNAVLSVGYIEADPVYQGQRPFSFRSIESYDRFNTVAAGSPTSVPATFSRPGVGEQQINPATGTLVPAFASFNFNPYNIFQTPFERFNIFGSARYEISDAIEVYTRGLFSKNSVATIVAPSGVFNSTVTINLNNPFLPVAARNQFCATNDFNPGLAGVQTLTPAECAAAAAATGPADPNYRTFTTGLRRRTTEAGPRLDTFTTQIFDYMIGFKGGITETLTWDVWGSYGESENQQVRDNYIALSRVRQALLANNPTTCITTTNNCVPLNIFGPDGSITPDMADFLTVKSYVGRVASLAQVRGTVSGDFGVASPWAEQPIAIAIGAEYREYEAGQEPDTLAASAGELGGGGGAQNEYTGGYNVYEAFGELVLPLVEDRPFFDSLQLGAGIRYSKYEVAAPNNPKFNTWTWKVDGSWSPGAGVTVRGAYNKAVRAPNIAELFLPPLTGLTNLSNDPCAGVAPTLNANLRSVCLAQGAPAFTIGAIPQPAAAQANATGGGNLSLKPEKATTWTAGVILQPQFAPSLTITADYYNIRITDAITTPTPGDAILACFGADPTNPPASAATDPACTQIRRNPNTGGLDGSPAETPGLFLGLTNQGTIETDGIDVTANYKTDLGFAELSLGLTGNWTNSSKFQASPTSINRECVGFYSVNCSLTGSIQPKFQFSQRTTLGFDNIDVSLLWRYIDGVRFEPQQFADDLAAAQADPAGCPDPLGADPGGCLVDVPYRKIKAAHYFDLTTRFNVIEPLTLTVSVLNLFDKKPPVVGNTIGSTTFNSGNTYPATYDALGRRFAVSARLKF
jgi:outer membrane receptor protein involved in Fe transport